MLHDYQEAESGRLRSTNDSDEGVIEMNGNSASNVILLFNNFVCYIGRQIQYRISLFINL